MSAANDAIFREIRVNLPRADSLTLAIALDEGLALPDLSGYFETLYDENRPGDDRTEFTLYFPIQEELAAVRVEVLLAALALNDAQVVEKTIRREDYLEAYKQHYVSFDLSDRVRIVPSWERDSASIEGANFRTPLFLDPGLAFGTGKHPTTALCVQLYDRLDPRDLRIIDAGTGSGILSLAALLLGAAEILAFDVDNNSLAAVRHNLQANRDGILRARPGDLRAPEERLRLLSGGFELAELAQFPADLMLANITAKTLLSARERINSIPARRLALSGILEEQAEETAAGFADVWRRTDLQVLEGWVLMEFERRSDRDNS